MLLIATKLLDAFGLNVVAGSPAAFDSLFISLQIITSTEAQYCDEHFSLFRCLSVRDDREHISETTCPTSPFLYTSLMSVALSFTGGVAINKMLHTSGVVDDVIFAPLQSAHNGQK